MDLFLSPVKPQVESVSEPEPQSDTIEDLLGYDINLVKNIMAEINNEEAIKEIKKYDVYYRNSIITTPRYKTIEEYINDTFIYSQPIPIRAIQDGTVPFRLGNENNLVFYLYNLPFDALKPGGFFAKFNKWDLQFFSKDEKAENKKYEFVLFVIQQKQLDEQLITTKKKSGFSYREAEYENLYLYSFDHYNFDHYNYVDSPLLLVSSNHEEPIRTVWVNLVEDEPNTKTSFPEKTPEELAQQFSLSKFASEEALNKSKSIQYVFPDNDYVKKVSHNTLFVDMVLSGVKKENEPTWLGRTKTKYIPYNDSYYFIIPKRINVYQKFVAKYTTSARHTYNDSDPNFTWNDVVEREIEIGNGKYLLLERIDGGYTNDNGDIFHWKDNYGNYYNLHNKQKIPYEEEYYYERMDEKLREGDVGKKLHIDRLYGGGNKRKKRKTCKPSKKRKTNKSRRVQKQK
jgi:hypothetical protein